MLERHYRHSVSLQKMCYGNDGENYSKLMFVLKECEVIPIQNFVIRRKKMQSAQTLASIKYLCRLNIYSEKKLASRAFIMLSYIEQCFFKDL